MLYAPNLDGCEFRADSAGCRECTASRGNGDGRTRGSLWPRHPVSAGAPRVVARVPVVSSARGRQSFIVREQPERRITTGYIQLRSDQPARIFQRLNVPGLGFDLPAFGGSEPAQCPGTRLGSTVLALWFWGIFVVVTRDSCRHTLRPWKRLSKRWLEANGPVNAAEVDNSRDAERAYLSSDNRRRRSRRSTHRIMFLCGATAGCCCGGLFVGKRDVAICHARRNPSHGNTRCFGYGCDAAV